MIVRKHAIVESVTEASVTLSCGADILHVARADLPKAAVGARYVLTITDEASAAMDQQTFSRNLLNELLSDAA